MMVLLTLSLCTLGFLSGFIFSTYKSSKFAASQQDYILELQADNLKIKKLLKEKAQVVKPARKFNLAKKKAIKKRRTKKVL